MAIYVKLPQVQGTDPAKHGVNGVLANYHWLWAYEQYGDRVKKYTHQDETFLAFQDDAEALMYKLSVDNGELLRWAITHCYHV